MSAPFLDGVLEGIPGRAGATLVVVERMPPGRGRKLPCALVCVERTDEALLRLAGWHGGSASLLAGMREAYTDAGLSLDPSALIGCRAGASNMKEPSRLLFDELLRRRKGRELSTAILASEDYLALEMIELFEEGGMEVPGDVSIIGFDDIPAARSGGHPLTTIRPNGARVGSAAAGFLVERIRGEGPPEPRELGIVPDLVIRESTAPPRARR